MPCVIKIAYETPFGYMEVVSKWLPNKTPLPLQLEAVSKWLWFILNCQ